MTWSPNSLDITALWQSLRLETKTKSSGPNIKCCIIAGS
jgi:hypothetical protein